VQKFDYLKAIVAPLNRANVDTDMIIPKQFLKSIKRTGFGKNLFDELRYLDEGQPDEDCSGRPLNPDFVLNMPRYQGAQVLLAGDNFGCGSSREHAPWALADYGFRVIIAPSFADIFYNNSFKNGILLITLAAAQINKLFTEIEKNEGYMLDIDLIEQSVVTPTGERYSFTIDAARKEDLLLGLDDIGRTLADSERIKAFEQVHRKKYPWIDLVEGVS